jgi:hypothetical protein
LDLVDFDYKKIHNELKDDEKHYMDEKNAKNKEIKNEKDRIKLLKKKKNDSEVEDTLKQINNAILRVYSEISGKKAVKGSLRD